MAQMVIFIERDGQQMVSVIEIILEWYWVL